MADITSHSLTQLLEVKMVRFVPFMYVTIVAHTLRPVNNGHYRTHVVAIHRLI